MQEKFGQEMMDIWTLLQYEIARCENEIINAKEFQNCKIARQLPESESSCDKDKCFIFASI